ncbi:MAG: FecR domain-containing protein [Deltaproteobacteria bacterium]|nr:FecR domain-containing protein [Deltaproteobacteria bacterium]
MSETPADEGQRGGGRRSRAGPLLVLGALIVGAIAVAVAYFALFTRREQRSEPPPPAPPVVLTMAAAEGTVEVFRGGAWGPARVGDRLEASDRVRTGEDGQATLRLSDGSLVRLEAATETQVQTLSRALSRIRLGGGGMQADIADDPERLFQVDLDDEGAAARTRGAAFGVTATSKGNAAVAATRGEVAVSARGREVVLRSGQFTRVAPGAPPTDAAPLPASLLLKVAWPGGEKGLVRATSAVVAGQTDPGSRIVVQGRHVAVDSEGRYRAEVTLREGANRVTVRARDVAGRQREERSPPITVDTKTDFKVQVPRWK